MRVDADELARRHEGQGAEGEHRRAGDRAGRVGDAPEEPRAGHGEQRIDRKHVADADVVGRADRREEEDARRQQEERRVRARRFAADEEAREQECGQQQEGNRALREERHEEVGRKSFGRGFSEEEIDSPADRVLPRDAREPAEVVGQRRRNVHEVLERAREARGAAQRHHLVDDLALFAAVHPRGHQGVDAEDDGARDEKRAGPARERAARGAPRLRGRPGCR